MVKFYGIRHHGPGSAKSLMQALESQKPDLVLIEGPEDLNGLFHSDSINSVSPPVAAVSYDLDKPNDVILFPIAEFSPEWCAITYSLQKQIIYKLIDAPNGIIWPDVALDAKKFQKVKFIKRKEFHPFEYLAKFQGITDIELWWEINFEKSDSHNHFEQISWLMKSLEPELLLNSSFQTQVREAWMRQNIRKAIDDGYSNIALICGAAHLPFLENFNSYNTKNDLELCSNVEQQLLESLWVPWTYRKLSSYLSSYAAGVKYPNYYEFLFKFEKDAPKHIFSTLAVFLREKGFEVSPSHSISAFELAESLASIRGFTSAGIDEIIESSHTIFKLNNLQHFDEAISEVFVGHKLGKVQVDYSKHAVVIDFYDKIKKAGLKKYLIPNMKQEVILDLRIEKDKCASKLIWQLKLIGIDWGTTIFLTQKSYGTFKESWLLDWKDDFFITLYQSVPYGNTLLEVVYEIIIEKISTQLIFQKFLIIFECVLYGDVKELLPKVIQKFELYELQKADVVDWISLINKLTIFLKLGTLRDINIQLINEIIETSLPKIFTNLDILCSSHVQNQDGDAIQAFEMLNQAVLRFENDVILCSWFEALSHLEQNYVSTPKFKGWANGILVQNDQKSNDLAMKSLSFTLSNLLEPEKGASWLSGYFQSQAFNNSQIPEIVNILSDWFQVLAEDEFFACLPILRKSFSLLSKDQTLYLKDFIFKVSNSTQSESSSEFDIELLKLLIENTKKVFFFP